MMTSIKPYLHRIGTGPKGAKDLTYDEAREAMGLILDRHASDAQIGAFLIAMRIKGSSPNELSGFIDAIRERSVLLQPSLANYLDCASPYDGRTRYLNLSLFASIVTAAAGVPVVMHGDSCLPPKCGVTNYDIVEALGVSPVIEPERAIELLETVGITFLAEEIYSPKVHALKQLRGDIELRTPIHTAEHVFNLANAPCQMTGVAHKPYLALHSETLILRKCRRAIIVHSGLEGSEEIAVFRRANAREIIGQEVRDFVIEPAALGFPSYEESALPGGDASYCLQLGRAVLAGVSGAPRDLVRLNAGVRVYAGGGAPTIEEGIELATEAIDSGKAQAVLDNFVHRLES